MLIQQNNLYTYQTQIIGYPLTHSFSPLLHNTLYADLQISAQMQKSTFTDLKKIITHLRTTPIALTAVTMPFKEKIIPLLDVIDPMASATGAVNTIIQRAGKLYGYNTDIDGIAFTLRHITLEKKNVLIIGAGGAARAAAVVLRQHHAHIYWLNRTRTTAETLAAQFSGQVLDADNLSTPVFFDVMINATPIGLPTITSSFHLPDHFFHAKQMIFDMLYHPQQTTFLQRAAKAGAVCSNGLDLFITQGIRQIELWQKKQLLTHERIVYCRSLLQYALQNTTEKTV